MGKYGLRPREDKSVLTRPLCPFCRNIFAPPRQISMELGLVSGGKCDCGASYVYDASSKNMGEAFMDALVYACNDDWDYALTLETEKDFSEVYLNYTEQNHTISIKRPKTIYEKNGNMVFIKLKKANEG